MSIEAAYALKIVDKSSDQNQEDTDPGLGALRKLMLALERVNHSTDALLRTREKQRKERQRTLRILKDGQKLLKAK